MSLSQSQSTGTSRNAPNGADDIDPIREETEDGTSYIIIPTVAQREGVYKYPTTNGISREFVPGEELTADPDAWDGVPLTLRHPIVNNDGAPEYGLTTAPGAKFDEVGEFREDRSDESALRGEAWIPKANLGRYGGELKAYVNAIRDGEYGEVSTGYDSTPVAEPGSYDGERYHARQTAISPDHVALLPDETGNCPIASGCGVGRINREDGTEAETGESGVRARLNASPVTTRTNRLSEARTPSYDGTRSGDSWPDGGPGLEDYIEGYYEQADADPDEIPSQWGDLPQSARDWIAAKSLLGDPDADSADDGVSYAVVYPDEDLSEDGLDSARRMARQGSHGESTAESIIRVTERLLEDEFGREFDDDDEDRENTNQTTAMSDTSDPTPTTQSRITNALNTLAEAAGVPLSRLNQTAGDAVRWESEAGGEREPANERYGVVVDNLQEDDDDVVLVAVYQPTSDGDGWESRNEQLRMNEDTLERLGPNGVDSLPPVSDVRTNTSPDASDGGDQETDADQGAAETSSDADDATEDERDRGAEDSDADGVEADSATTDPDAVSTTESESESASESTDQPSDEPAESGMSDTDTDDETDTDTTQSMSDRTTELVEEHGFDAENLPDEEEDCFDKIYERFTSTESDAASQESPADTEAEAGESEDVDADTEQSGDDVETQSESTTEPETQDVTEPETTESPETANAPETAEDEQVVVNKNDLADIVDERVEQRLEEEKKSHERQRQEHAIVNSSAAPFEEDDLEEMNDAAVSRIVDKFDVMSEQAQQAQAQAPSESGPAGTYGGVKMPRSNAETTETKEAPVAGGLQSRLAGDRTNSGSNSNDGGD